MGYDVLKEGEVVCCVVWDMDYLVPGWPVLVGIPVGMCIMMEFPNASGSTSLETTPLIPPLSNDIRGQIVPPAVVAVE